MHAGSYASALAKHPGVDFVGVWDEDEDAGTKFAARHGVPFFEDSASLLDQVPDGVIVTSENVFHRGLVEAAASAGVRAILCEKPIATTLSDAQAMVDLCTEKGVRLATAFPCRFSAPFQRLNSAVKSGKLGEILAIRATNHGVCPFGWFVEPEKSGGGAIIDHTVHVADLNRVLLGSEAVEVYAERGNNMYHQAWEDCGFLTITYANGTFCTLDSSWSRPKKSFPTWGDVTMEMIGTGGVANLDMFSQATTLHSEATANIRYLGWGSEMDAGMVNEFLLLASGQETDKIATGVNGLRALEVALAAYESIRIGLPVRIDEFGRN